MISEALQKAGWSVSTYRGKSPRMMATYRGLYLQAFPKMLRLDVPIVRRKGAFVELHYGKNLDAVVDLIVEEQDGLSLKTIDAFRKKAAKLCKTILREIEAAV